MQKQEDEFGIVARRKGGPEVLEWTRLDSAAPGAGEVRLVQKAIGLNFIDTYYRQGAYAWPSDTLIPGGEAAGIVEAVGAGTSFAVGDHVAYTMPIGAYRTHRVVPADRLVKLPAEVSFEEAASLMLKGLTAQYLLKSTSRAVWAYRAGACGGGRRGSVDGTVVEGAWHLQHRHCWLAREMRARQG